MIAALNTIAFIICATILMCVWLHLPLEPSLKAVAGSICIWGAISLGIVLSEDI